LVIFLHAISILMATQQEKIAKYKLIDYYVTERTKIIKITKQH